MATEPNGLHRVPPGLLERALALVAEQHGAVKILEFACAERDGDVYCYHLVAVCLDADGDEVEAMIRVSARTGIGIERL